MLLDEPDGPEDYEPTLTAFRLANSTAIEQFPSYLAENSGRSGWSSTRSATTPSPATVTGPLEQSRRRAGDGHPGAGARRDDPRADPAGTGWPGNAGHADHGGNRGHRAEAIRWALDRIREQPAYQRLRELRGDADKLRNEF